jgi:dihydropteroate synthase-like protein
MGTLLFVTGKLAEPALRRTVAGLSERFGIRGDVAVLPISVVALAPTEWIARHLMPPSGVDRVVLPGLCSGDLAVLGAAWPGVEIQRGPKDLLDLPDFFGMPHTRPDGYGDHDIEILAEINHAPRLPLADILTKARQAKADGADVIDLGCDPGGPWAGVDETVRALRDEGLRVSIDTFDVTEAAVAAKAGAELVLSVNRTNRHAARDWGIEVVVVPDEAGTLDGLGDTLAALDGVPHRLDPILEPIGFGFANSLVRYAEVRRLYPDAEMLMGVGNLTELTGVDSAGMNVALAGYCQELGIRSVLTTEVINWARSSVRELDLARRLVAYAVRNRVLPKRLEPDLVMLRDPRLHERGPETLAELAATITDKNFRLFAERGLIHVLAKGLRFEGDDPFALFARMLESRPIDPSHAFYLGYEMAKARMALTLGKNYVQDQALRWGFLTREERPGGHA